jgi:hypothetical protein
MRHRFFWVWFAVGMALFPAVAQALECDPMLTPTPGAQGYRVRADDIRCEGFYVSPVSGPPIEIVSFTYGSLAQLSPRNRRVAVQLAVAQPPQGPVFVRATGIPMALYYRLDGELRPGRGLTWPLEEVLAHDRLTGNEVGVYAYVRSTAGSITYLPVSVSLPGNTPPVLGHPRIVLRALEGITDATWALDGGTCHQAKQPFTEATDRLVADLCLDQGATGTLAVTWRDNRGTSRTRTYSLQF